MKGVIVGLLQWVASQGKELADKAQRTEASQKELVEAKEELARAKEELKSLRARDVGLEYMHEGSFAEFSLR